MIHLTYYGREKPVLKIGTGKKNATRKKSIESDGFLKVNGGKKSPRRYYYYDDGIIAFTIFRVKIKII